MIVITSKEFIANQQKYFDLLGVEDQLIIKDAKKKAYIIRPLDADDIYFTKEMMDRIEHSSKQAEAGKVTRLSQDDVKKILGL